MEQKITEMYAWIVTETDGSEGIPAISKHGMMFPLIGADKIRIESCRPDALFVADNKPLKLVKFSNMEVLEEFE
jgi:hypothetical protein